jgi:hypothetical protein
MHVQPLNPTTPHQEQRSLGQIKRLTQALIVSGTVNILLIAFVLYGFFGSGMLVFRDSLKPRLSRTKEAVAHPEKSMAQVLQSYQQLSLEQLIAKLEDTSERDLALGYLIWRHHFNLLQALVDCAPTTCRHIPIRTGQHVSQLTLYPDLTDRQYAALVQFAKTERWPLTSEGLFHELKHHADATDPSLAEAFFLTPEFLTLQRTFARSDLEISKRELLELAMKFDWTTFQSTVARLHVPPEMAKRALSELMAVQSLAKAHQQVLVAEVSPAAPNPTPPQAAKVHVVKQGESLWKIAKNYHVDIAALKAHNHLQSDLLRPGANLCIP